MICRRGGDSAEDMAAEGEEERGLPSFHYPFHVPPGVALACYDGESKKFYCVVPGCHAVLGYVQAAYAHLRAEHSEDQGFIKVRVRHV